MTLVDVAVAERIATLTLNNPDRLNAYTPAMKDEFIAGLDRADGDDDVGAVLVTGAGRAFCAGMDLSNELAFSRTDEPEDRRRRDSGGEMAMRLFAMTKPVIAAINGAAIGVGVTMTLPMDFRLCTPQAKFGFVFAQRGIVLETASSWFLPRLVGMQRAADWAYTGRVFGADEALQAGLVRSVHAPEDLLRDARALAHQIIDNTAPVSVALNRQLLWRGLTFDHPMQSHRAESRAMYDRGTSPDVTEGMASFLERRPAVFTQRVPTDLPDIWDAWPPPTYTP
jgi:enoyl-CoA hydratase/carnithine racemase